MQSFLILTKEEADFFCLVGTFMGSSETLSTIPGGISSILLLIHQHTRLFFLIFRGSFLSLCSLAIHFWPLAAELAPLNGLELTPHWFFPSHLAYIQSMGRLAHA